MSYIRDPLNVFHDWYLEAKEEKDQLVDAFCLSTVNSRNEPLSRMVLLKDYGSSGFVFYTNLESEKSLNIKINPTVSMCFYWHHTGKQVRVGGEALLIEDEKADKYFESRSNKSKIGAWVSRQSKELEGGMKNLYLEIEEAEKKFMDKDISRPDHWSGFRIIPSLYEFWQRGEHRLHERIVYKASNILSRKEKIKLWKKKRLYP